MIERFCLRETIIKSLAYAECMPDLCRTNGVERLIFHPT
jgi:hypothetical protein